MVNESNAIHESSIAIIGMGARFPGAKDLDEFWENLCSAKEAVRDFSDEELLAAGVDPERLTRPNYVKRGVELKNIDLFDAEFFGYTPREAELIDPQHRIFLECAWEALEDAGWQPERDTRRVGVFAGSGLNNYGLYRSALNPGELFSWTELQKSLLLEKDYLTTRVSYKLNLSGPSVVVQTACSTSLVAVHMACQSLLSGESDMALAGGVSIRVPQVAGYLHEEGGPASADGHCRAFDADASGMVLGSGAGIVVLKRLEDAIADGDNIRAVIRATCINNDGSGKAGYTAPSVDAQAEAIAEAHALAGITASDVSYVEAHGTGTKLGDPVEIAGLTKAFRRSSRGNGFCAVGSVKAGIGHLDIAAGVAGLIKLVLCLEHGMLPPSVNFTRPNPHIDFEETPFFVQQSLSPWVSRSETRIAGLSSFGIGGTNAHAVIEEAPRIERKSREVNASLITLSARSPQALEAATDRLADYLERHSNVSLDDVAFTLSTGRAQFDYRRCFVSSDTKQASDRLRSRDAVFSGRRSSTGLSSIVFMFPGQGAQYVGMGKGLYHHEQVFREAVDYCSDALVPHLELDLRDVLYPAEQNRARAQELIRETWVTQPALFVVEYGLSLLWKSWGIVPEVMIGHSIGEYVAGCLSGVFSLDDALTLVAARGRLMNGMQPGAMLAVRAGEGDVRELLTDGLEVATINSPRTCVVSGSFETIAGFSEFLSSRDILSRQIPTSHAFHSAMMEPALAPFRDELRRIRLGLPSVPFVSNVTGQLMLRDEAVDPEYWVQHLRRSVRFSDGIQTLLQDCSPVLLEVGPGRTLSGFARQSSDAKSAAAILPSMEAAGGERSDREIVLETLGRLWSMGFEPDWTALYAHGSNRKVSLPAYPFERKRFWNMPEPALSHLPRSQAKAKRTDTRSGATPENTVKKAVADSIRDDPRTETSTTADALEQIWKDLLGFDAIDRASDFFDLGGDSLLATKVLARIHGDMNQKVTLKQFFDTPTIQALAAILDDSERNGHRGTDEVLSEADVLKKASML